MKAGCKGRDCENDHGLTADSKCAIVCHDEVRAAESLCGPADPGQDTPTSQNAGPVNESLDAGGSESVADGCSATPTEYVRGQLAALAWVADLVTKLQDEDDYKMGMEEDAIGKLQCLASIARLARLRALIFERQLEVSK